jgi:hypothetical protein
MRRRNDWNRSIIPPFSTSSHLAGLSIMGPVSFVIAIMGCADGGGSCQQVAVAPTRYESAAACEAATAPVLAGATDFDFPTLLARCQSAKSPAAVQRAPARKSGQLIKEG